MLSETSTLFTLRAIISGIYQKDVLAHNLCDFTAILLMDIVLTLPKFAKKFMIIQVIQT